MSDIKSNTSKLDTETSVNDGDYSSSDEVKDKDDVPLLPAPWQPPMEFELNCGLTGLLNLGNTCYLNSVLQALSNLPHISYFFTYGWPYAAPPINKFAKDTKPERRTFVNYFAHLIQVVWSGKVKDFRATQLARSVIEAVPEFQLGGQQDAQEALNYMLNHIHDELLVHVPATHHPARDFLLKFESHQKALQNANAARQRLNNNSKRNSRESKSKKTEGKRSSSESKKSDEEPQKLRQAHAKYAQSIINDTFLTFLTQKITCKTCGSSSVSLEEYLELSLALPSKGQMKDIRRQSTDESDNHSERSSDSGDKNNTIGSTNSKGIGNVWGSFKSIIGWNSHSLQLVDCLRAFFAPEKLEGNEKYYCEYCKSKEEAVKAYSLAHVPEILCIHLKRFNKTTGWGLGNSKNSTPVHFPVEGLDLSPFLYDDASNGMDDKVNTYPKHDALYDLVSIVKHCGGINSGHYTSVCKNQADDWWYEFDDEFVSRYSDQAIREENVSNSEAYLLFYVKRRSASQKATRTKIENMLMKNKDTLASLPPEPTNRYYVPFSWIIKWTTFTNPSIIDFHSILCEHGGINRLVAEEAENRLVAVSKQMWIKLEQTYGSTAILDNLDACETCLQQCSELQERRIIEHEEFLKRNKEKSQYFYLVHTNWLHAWRSFVLNEDLYNGRGTAIGVKPPGKVSNDALLDKDGQPKPKLSYKIHYKAINESTWFYFMETYGGGPAFKRKIGNIYAGEDDLDAPISSRNSM